MSNGTKNKKLSLPKEVIEHMQAAINAGNAVNLGAVVHRFKAWIDYAQKESHVNGLGTEWVNNHPISILFTQALGNINHANSTEIFSEAYESCQLHIRLYKEENKQ